MPKNIVTVVYPQEKRPTISKLEVGHMFRFKDGDECNVYMKTDNMAFNVVAMTTGRLYQVDYEREVLPVNEITIKSV